MGRAPGLHMGKVNVFPLKFCYGLFLRVLLKISQHYLVQLRAWYQIDKWQCITWANDYCYLIVFLGHTELTKLGCISAFAVLNIKTIHHTQKTVKIGLSLVYSCVHYALDQTGEICQVLQGSTLTFFRPPVGLDKWVWRSICPSIQFPCPEPL